MLPKVRGQWSGPRRERRAPSIDVLVPDPYLEYLIASILPGASIRIRDGRDGDQADGSDAAVPPDLVVVELDDPRAADLMADASVRVVVVADGSKAALLEEISEVDGLVFRPFDRADLALTLRSVLGLDRADRAYAPPSPGMLRTLGFARVVAVGIAAALEVNVTGWRAVLLAVMVIYAAARLVTSRRAAMVHVLIDVGVVVVALGFTGGTVGGYSMLAAVVAFEVGLLLANRAVLAFGGGIFLVAAAGLTSELIRGDVFTSGKLAALVLIPTAAMMGVLLRRVWRVSERSAFAAVDEANRLLSSLHQVVRALPRQLDISSVTTSMIEDLTETVRAHAAAVVVGEAGLLSVRAELRMGLRVGQVVDTVGGHLRGLTEKRSTIVAVDELPPAFAATPTPEVTVIPMSRHRDVMGFLIVAGRWSEHDVRYLQQLADEAAVALENARLFGRLRLLTVDQERDRVARELHDGVAQVMTHLRLELGLLAQGYTRDDETPQEAAARLGGRFDGATQQLRELMAQLSSTLAGGDLLGAVRRYVQDVDALGGPHVRVRFDSVPAVSGPSGRLLFDLIRSTIAIAVRAPNATSVNVQLEAWEDVLVATVVGDGSYAMADELAQLGERARDHGVLYSIEHDDEGLRRVEIASPLQTSAAAASAPTSDGRNVP